ncbi:hypothetical protein BD410DRAFT_813193 [Rickenella mellea]|uniref:K Homology domain-containing protein n=1 Tax=Rickenella mellea TaxID=50990 RepID=A0A4Y7QGB3_9AGAM|nr:hypothetical protein BD410DRAFT_813193 [Rickenella mellea]
MASLSAAELQRRHELEGAPDPFPSLGEETVQAKPMRKAASSPSGTTAAPPDTDSEQAFPSLAPAAAAPAPRLAAASSWGSAAPRIQPAAVAKQSVVSDTFSLTAADLSHAGKDGKPTSLGEIMKQVMVKHKVKIEASTNQRTKQTTFHVKSESAKELDKAKRMLIAQLSPIVTVTLNAPASTIASIIGPKGATLKQIRDQTNVRVDIPRKDSLSPPQANGNGSHRGSPTPTNDGDDDEVTVPVTISGPEPLVHEAQAMLKAIIATKTAKITQRVRDIPAHIVPFVKARYTEFLAARGDGDATLGLKPIEREVTVTGDRDAVIRVIEKVKFTIEFIKGDITSFSMSLPKRQHRLLVGTAVTEIMEKSKCGVDVPRPEDPSDQITVWGNANELSNGMAAVMQKANSQYIHEFPIPGPKAFSKQLVTYMARIGYPKTLAAAHPGVQVYTPPSSLLDKVNVLNIDIVGDKPKVDAAVEQLSSFISTLIGGMREVEVDWLVHRVITGKHAKKIKHFHDAQNVVLFFPPEAAEQSTVMLVYDPTSSTASRSPIEKTKHLDEVEKEFMKIAHDASDVKSQTITVDKKWHGAVAGRDGTTLNAIIGEEKTVSIKIGADANGPSDDAILVRGASADVDRAVQEINRIVENAKNDEIDNSYSVEFDIARDYVGRVVGTQGAAVNKLRDTLGVKIDFTDEADEREKDSGKKKKAVTQKSKVKITGRKENVEEAKKRILTQVERLADETSEVLKIPAQYHSALIGQSGKYVIRLEEKYSVKITFPRESTENGDRTREPLKTDEVLIKGGKKGVAGAKSEIVEAVDFEKESNNVIKFTVPTRSVARILGRGGASINDIKDETGAQIDVDKGTDDTAVTHISCRGTKKAIAAAKAAIMEIADSVGEETNVALTIENKYHRTIIGGGGQGLKDIITRCGGPSDPKAQAGLIRFPRQGEPSDEVRLRGNPALVKKLQAELEKVATSLRDRVVLLVDVPHAQHRALIGRGGQHLNDLQNRTGAQVQFPGSRSYHQVGEPENADEFKDADPQNLVKVFGPRAACESAIKDLTAQIKAPAPEAVTATVSVPLKYHHVISQQGNFFRTLRSFGVNVDQSSVPQKSAVPTQPPTEPAPTTTTARIDDATEDSPVSGSEFDWQVIPNYQDSEEGESEWTLKARDDAGLERAQKLIAEAIEHAGSMSSVGFLTLSDRTFFPRIVGTKGANVARLRAETGADITVSRENSTIVIIGSESSIETAKDSIIRTVSGGSGRRRD